MYVCTVITHLQLSKFPDFGPSLITFHSTQKRFLLYIDVRVNFTRYMRALVLAILSSYYTDNIIIKIPLNASSYTVDMILMYTLLVTNASLATLCIQVLYSTSHIRIILGFTEAVRQLV